LKKSLLRHLLAIGIFIAVSFIYFYPALQGYTLKMADISNWQGMSKEVSDYRLLFGEETLWTNSMFGGMPAFQISAKYALNLINYVYKAILALPSPVKFLFALALGFYILLCSLKIDYKISVIGAIVFALSSYFIIIIGAGHTSKVVAAAFMAPVLAGFILTYNGKIWRGLALVGIAMALELRANHLQITYYLGFILLAYTIAEFYRAYKHNTLPVFVRRSVSIGIVLFVAVLTNSGNLFNTLEYSKYTTRGPSELMTKADGTSNDDIKTTGLDRDYVTAWSYGKEESLTFIIPDAKGGATGRIENDPGIMNGISSQYRNFVTQNNRYWGDQSFTSGPVYLGIVVFYLFLLGMFSLRSRFKWVILSIIILALFLSWGKNLMWLTDIFLDYLPGYNKFRAVTIILVLVELMVPLLAFIFLNRAYMTPAVFNNNFKVGNKEIGSRFIVVSGVFAFFLILLYLFPTSFQSFFSDQELSYFTNALGGNNAAQAAKSMDALETVRINIFKADVVRSLAFLIVAFIVLLLYKVKTLSNSLMVIILGLIMIIDLWSVDKRYLNNDKSKGKYISWEKKEKNKLAFLPSKADLDILNRELLFNFDNPELEEITEEALVEATEEAKASGDFRGKLSEEQENNVKFRTLNLNSDFRVLNISVSTFNDASTSYFFKSIGGYHGAKLKIYQELIEFEIQPEIQELLNRLNNGVKPHLAFKDMNALNMLNTQYLIYNSGSEPVENPNSLGEVWFVNNINWVVSPDEEILSIKETNPATTAIIRQEYENRFNDFEFLTSVDNNISLTQYRPNKLTYDANIINQQFAVFSEIWYPNGWKATIDGKETEIIRVNYVLRGLLIPPGEHTIVFSFEPPGYQAANIVSLVSSLALILFCLWVLVKIYRGSLAVRQE
jgi:hypothetical protein